MSNFNERLVLRKTIPSYNDRTILVCEKLGQSSDQKWREERFNQRIKSLTEENEVLEIMLKNKSNDLAKLDKQFNQKLEQYSELKHDRDLLDMHLQSEIRNSNRLNRDVQGLLSTNKSLLDQIDRLKSEHIEEMRKRLDKSKKQH